MKFGESYLKDFEAEKEKAAFDPVEQLESVKIDLNGEIKPPPPVIQLDDLHEHPVTIFTEGNISVVKGRAKVRKSFALAMITASALSNIKIYRKFISIPEKLVVYFDTEQSSFYVQQSMFRIRQISHGTGFNDRFLMFALRKFNPAERLELIDWVFNNIKNIGFVVIDGIRDLLKDINSADESTMISSMLLKWSEKTKAHICVVLHENPSDGKLRGHIGTELMNKAETVLKVEKLENDKKHISKITGEMMRGLDFKPIYFTINDNIPELISNEDQSEIENFYE